MDTVNRVFTTDDLTKAMAQIHKKMKQNRQRLIDMDSVIGDGDLGITMEKGFGAAAECARQLEDEDIGIRLKKIGFAISKAAPSTMGTLLASAYIDGGKKLTGKRCLTVEDLAQLFAAMAAAIQLRGKATEGEKTVLDVLAPAARSASQAASLGNMPLLFQAVVSAAEEGLERGKAMMSQRGKAAVFREKTIGMEDPGGAAAVLMLQGFAAFDKE